MTQYLRELKKYNQRRINQVVLGKRDVLLQKERKRNLLKRNLLKGNRLKEPKGNRLKGNRLKERNLFNSFFIFYFFKT